MLPRLETVERVAAALGLKVRLDVEVASREHRDAVYLDANATTAIDDRVAAAVVEALAEPANAGSGHWAGNRAKTLVGLAREQVADLLACSPSEIIFTSGATEANAIAMLGVADANRLGHRRKIVGVSSEHPSMLRPLDVLRTRGWDVVTVGVDHQGLFDRNELDAAVDDNTLVVSVMAANNETGVMPQLSSVAAICQRTGAMLHTDATQLMAWGPLDVKALGVDLLSMSAHKMHGPQGTGALYVSRDVLRTRGIAGLTVGGGQEQGLRGGTVNVPGAVGFGVAASLAIAEGAAAAPGVAALRDNLEARLAAAIPALRLNGSRESRTPGTLNVSFGGMPADAIMAGAPQVAVSTGSACATGAPGPSHVLKAMGVSDVLAESSLRFSLSRQTTADDIAAAAEAIIGSFRRLVELEGAVA